ncbi:MFS transporter [Thermobifida halotolerans]|uniref:MFS transporter n=1 Tax=Thermobifida halotolerans TaxID=483545 RepID=A0A399FZ28_9ACTN|nr:MFS transporter [Thermobifida halotolerans]UOE22183.1 MFS transporter [Thermobifida halotolerans]
MFRSLRIRNYRLFAVGQVISNSGTWMQRIAQEWLVLQLSGGSGVALGIATALQFLPMLVLGLWGGALADRFPKRRLLLATQILMGLLALGLGVLATLGTAEVWHVYVFALGLGLVTVVDNPVRQSFVIEMVGRQDLPNAVALNSAGFQLGRVVGPAVAGLLIGLVGSGPVFLINAASFVAVITGLLMMRPEELHTGDPASRSKGQVREGLRYIAGRRDLTLLLAMIAFVQLFGSNVQTQLALMVNNVFRTGAEAFGLAATFLAVGALSGALLAARREAPRLRTVVLGAFLFGVLQIVAGFMPGYVPFLLALVPMGICFMTFTTSMNAYFQLNVEPGMRGRVMAMYMLVFLGVSPIGAPIVGVLADVFGPAVSMVVGGAVSALVAAAVTAILGRRLGVGVRLTAHRPFVEVTRRSAAESPRSDQEA